MRYLIAIILLTITTIAHAIDLDESPIEPGEWGFRPAADTASDLNPPPFAWRPASGADTYRLEIARDAKFEDVVYTVETRWSSHCPDIALPASQLHWRYRAIDGDEVSPWSKTRSFTIDANATTYPQPKVDELITRIPEERPRLFMRPDDLPKLRGLAEGPLADVWANILARADKTLASPPPTDEPPLYPPGTEYKSEEWRKIWWGNRTYGIRVADGAATLGFAYRITGEEKYGKAARDLLMAITEWDPEGSTQWKYNDEAAMPLMYMTSRAYDWAYPCFSDEDREKVIAMMRVRGRQCYDHLKNRHLWEPYSSHSNRAWHWLAELSTEFYDDIPEAPEWLEFAMTVYFTAYPVWSDSDGGWHEGSAYWSSYVGRFMHWAFIMKSAYNIDAFDRPYFDNAGDFALYTIPPGTQHGGFGDQAPKIDSSRAAPLMAVLASGARNPYWQWYADEHGVKLDGSYLDFFYRAAAGSLEAKAPTDIPTSKLFEGTGVAAMNTKLTSADGNVQLLFKSSPLGRRSHGYNAQNAFHLNVNGVPMLHGAGRRDIHGSPHHRQWMYHSKSQNAILVDGEGQVEDRYASTARIIEFIDEDDITIVAGEAGDAYEKLDRWTRRIFFIKSGSAIIHDIIEAPGPVSVEWLVHGPKKFQIHDELPQTAWLGESNASNVKVDVLYPRGLAVDQNDQYDPPPHDWAKFDLNEWHLTYTTKDKKIAHEFITVIDAGTGTPTPDATLYHDARAGKVRAEFAWRNEGKKLTLYSDGQYELSRK